MRVEQVGGGTNASCVWFSASDHCTHKVIFFTNHRISETKLQLHIALKRTEKHLKKNILLLVFRVNTKTTLCIVPIRTSAPLAVNSGTKFLVVSSVIIVTPPVGHCEGMHDVVQKAEGTENHANQVWILPDHGLFHRGIFHWSRLWMSSYRLHGLCNMHIVCDWVLTCLCWGRLKKHENTYFPIVKWRYETDYIKMRIMVNKYWLLTLIFKIRSLDEDLDIFVVSVLCVKINALPNSPYSLKVSNTGRP